MDDRGIYENFDNYGAYSLAEDASYDELYDRCYIPPFDEEEYYDKLWEDMAERAENEPDEDELEVDDYEEYSNFSKDDLTVNTSKVSKYEDIELPF